MLGDSALGTHIMQLVVEAACVAHRFAVLVAPPERGGCGSTVDASCPRASGR